MQSDIYRIDLQAPEFSLAHPTPALFSRGIPAGSFENETDVAQPRSRQQQTIKATPSFALKNTVSMHKAQHQNNAEVDSHVQPTASQTMAHGDARLSQASHASDATLGTKPAQRQKRAAPHAAEPAAWNQASKTGASSTSAPRASTCQVCARCRDCTDGA